jgi:hypothetical protein
MYESGFFQRTIRRGLPNQFQEGWVPRTSYQDRQPKLVKINVVIAETNGLDVPERLQQYTTKFI